MAVKITVNLLHTAHTYKHAPATVGNKMLEKSLLAPCISSFQFTTAYLNKLAQYRYYNYLHFLICNICPTLVRSSPMLYITEMSIGVVNIGPYRLT